MRLGLCASRDSLYAPGAGQHGLVGRDKCVLCWALLPSDRLRPKGAPVLVICVLTVLAKGYRLARLETRTKESNMYASR